MAGGSNKNMMRVLEQSSTSSVVGIYTFNLKSCPIEC